MPTKTIMTKSNLIPSKPTCKPMPGSTPDPEVGELKEGDYLYMLPKGRKGLFWDPEIRGVLSTYADMGVDFSNKKVQDKVAQEIGEAIRGLPLNPIVVDQPPIRRLDGTGNEYIIFPDGSTTENIEMS